VPGDLRAGASVPPGRFELPRARTRSSSCGRLLTRHDVARAAELGVDEIFWDHIAANVPHRSLLDALNSIADLRG
jgi:hypothetical protein